LCKLLFKHFVPFVLTLKIFEPISFIFTVSLDLPFLKNEKEELVVTTKGKEGEMTDDIYKRLANHLDELPGGFPATDTDVELRILKQLFTPEEAEFALHLTLIPEEPRVVARRTKISVEEAKKRLEEMAKKGLIFRLEEEPGKLTYMAAQYVIGIWEFNVNNLNTQLIKDMEEYSQTLFFDTVWKQPQLRTIPVGSSIQSELDIMPYEQAEELIQSHEKFAVLPCICKRERRMVGEGCDKPEETCLAFGIAADYSIKNGYGRAVEKTEISELLKKADELGLVLQPGNSKEVNFICCCCGCCCGVLRNLKKYPKPAEFVSTPFVLEVNQETCEGCGTCEDRCQMEALNLQNDKISYNVDRCIGCGLCVSTCPTDSLSLKRKPESQQVKIPKDAIAAAIGHGRARGKLGLGELIKMQAKSKIDRFLAPRL